MTSATYSKSSFKQGFVIFRWSVRSYLPLIIVYLSILAFYLLMDTVSSIGISTLVRGFEDEEASFIANLPVTMAIGNITFFGILFSIIASIVCFGYLHGKRETDMFGSLPVSRRTLFFSRLITAIAIGAVPMLVILLGINIFAPQNSINNWLNTLNAFLGITANVTFMGLLSICCGKVSNKIISYLMINGAFPVAVIMLHILPASFISGYTIDFHKHFILALTPLAASISNMPIYWTVFSVVCALLCFLLIKRRKAESAQSHFAFRLPHVLIKVLASFTVGVVTAYIFLLVGVTEKYEPNLGMEYVKFWAGMLIGSFFAYLIIQIILAHGFKGFAKSLITYGAMIVCFGILFTVLATDALGYSSYVPSADSVKSVSFTDNFNQKFIMKRSVDDRKVIEAAVEAHRQVIEQEEENKSMILTSGKALYNMLNSFGADSIDDTVTKFTVSYHLKNGITVRRSYTLDYDVDIDFFNTPEYCANYYPVFTFDSKYVDEATAWVDVYDDDYGYVEFNRKKSRELLETLREDYQKYGVIESDDWIDVDFHFREDSIDDEFNLFSPYYYQNFSVPHEYKATTKLINEQVKNETHR